LGSRTRTVRKVLTVGELIFQSAERLDRADLAYGHGTDNPFDEAAALVFHALNLNHGDAPRAYARVVSRRGRARVSHLITQRIRTRRPAAYLTRRMWFAGLEFYVDERVLVPRSPIAELIEQGFAPWADERQVRRVLDVGTGSGCIAVAAAKRFPRAQVDAVDISRPALVVARRNIRRHRLGRRVHALLGDLFGASDSRRYDIIVSNPPYVGTREFLALPTEYRREPSIALRSGPSGLDAVSRMLREAETFLQPNGILVVEVGNTQRALEKRYPGVPFTWIEFQRGGGGVFLLTREELQAHRSELNGRGKSRRL
jgi:ribosomal protein L3 glutamine methyltransferase